MKLIVRISFILLAFITSCKKDDDKELPTEPNISLVSIEPSIVKNFDNNVQLVIKYADNQGDLGYFNPDVPSLQVKDSRLDSADWYHVPPLATYNESLIIEGQLSITLNNLFILGNGDSELTDFSVKIRDRAGNWSNIVVTPTIRIQK